MRDEIKRAFGAVQADASLREGTKEFLAQRLYRRPVRRLRPAPLLACLACRHFPCRAMTEERLALLRTSPFVQLDTKNSKLLPRRHVMYIFRMTSGELRDAPEDFSPDAPDFEQLADVEEVLVIGKVLVKQLRLVAKPREERDRIREQLSTPDLPEEVEEEKPRRRRRSSVRDED